MPFLFDTDAISELMRPRPAEVFIRWLSVIEPAEQFVSAVTVGELYRGAYQSGRPEALISAIQGQVLPRVVVLSFDLPTARVYGEISGVLLRQGKRVEDTDVQIAATAITYGLELVTGNLRHFERIPSLRLNRILADARDKAGHGKPT